MKNENGVSKDASATQNGENSSASTDPASGDSIYSRLSILKMCGNGVRCLLAPGNLEFQSRLKVLAIQDNGIVKLPSFEHLTSLMEFYCYNNRLTHFPAKFSRVGRSLTKMFVEGNPFELENEEKNDPQTGGGGGYGLRKLAHTLNRFTYLKICGMDIPQWKAIRDCVWEGTQEAEMTDLELLIRGLTEGTVRAWERSHRGATSSKEGSEGKQSCGGWRRNPYPWDYAASHGVDLATLNIPGVSEPPKEHHEYAVTK